MNRYAEAQAIIAILTTASGTAHKPVREYSPCHHWFMGTGRGAEVVV